MKYLIAISVLLVVALADDPHGLKIAHEKCHVGAPEVQSKPEPSPKSDSQEDHHKDKHHIKHFKCFAQELGLVNNEGKVIVDGVKLHVGHVISDADKVEEIVKICAQERGSADATAGHVVKCLYKNHVFTYESEEDHSSGHHHAKHHHDHGPKPVIAPAKVR